MPEPVGCGDSMTTDVKPKIAAKAKTATAEDKKVLKRRSTNGIGDKNKVEHVHVGDKVRIAPSLVSANLKRKRQKKKRSKGQASEKTWKKIDANIIEKQDDIDFE